MIYLNNAATTYPKPREVLDAVSHYLSLIPFSGERSGLQGLSQNPIALCRQKLAKFFHIDNPNDIAFTSGSTESLNLAIMGLPLQNKHVITTSTEHNSVLRPLKALEKQGIIALTIVPCNAFGNISCQAIVNAIQTNTKAIVVNHCSNVTGILLDIETIAKKAREKGIVVVVDASQSAGSIEINANNVDILAFTGHKSLYGIQGIGGIYIQPNLELKPLKVGGTGSKSNLLHQPEDRPLRYEAGTPNVAGIISLIAGIDFIEKTGIGAIHTVKYEFTKKMMQALQKIPNVILYNQPSYPTTLFCFNIVGCEPTEIGYMLETFEIIVRSGLHCAPLIHQQLGTYPKGCVRVSPSYFNTWNEIELFIQAVEAIAQSKCK
jgi:cysteine desulfurase family protein